MGNWYFVLISDVHVMPQLRFPNNGIRAKATRRRGGQPRPAPMQSRPPMARLRPRPPARGRLVAARASPKGRPATLARGSAYRHSRLRLARRGGSRLQRGARKGLPPTSSPTASRGGDANHRGGLCRGNGDGTEGERGVRASFGEKDNPAPMNSENFEDYPLIQNYKNTLDNS
ncbi:hypothetical protein B296_00048156 [Ensete ventricosum]|uniref:Uncharacterized protein n=1 Tax=Ensete ventricosum TaxID=4639 RepID=A0A426WY94_ENSVE|nr:hypothetical protein B296_00048156 [Ensete ventricosum]